MSRNVLIVEDELELAEFVKRHLADLGCAVHPDAVRPEFGRGDDWAASRESPGTSGCPSLADRTVTTIALPHNEYQPRASCLKVSAPRLQEYASGDE